MGWLHFLLAGSSIPGSYSLFLIEFFLGTLFSQPWYSKVL